MKGEYLPQTTFKYDKQSGCQDLRGFENLGGLIYNLFRIPISEVFFTLSIINR